jgi:type VI secretion system protein VasG
MIDAILTNTLLPQISEGVLKGLMEGKPVKRVEVTARDNEFQYAFASN